jgi:hypothetical protein
MVMNGVTVSMGQVYFFVIITLVGIIVAIGFYKNINGKAN